MKNKKIKNWEKEELLFLQNNYNTMTINELSKVLNKKESTVYNAIREMGLKKQKHVKWTLEDINFLKENYNMDSKTLSNKLKHSIASINSKKNNLNLIKNSNWSDSEIAYLINNYHTQQYSDISKYLNRTEGAIRAKCYKLGLIKHDEWTDYEINYLVNNYFNLPNKELSIILNRSENAIHIKASKLGLKKTPYYCDYNFFETINTEEKAYWLGFLSADGWISKNEKNNSGVVGIELQYDDINHLKKFNKSINGNYKITERIRKQQINGYLKESHNCIIRIYSLVMYDSLLKWGFSNNKSYDISIPNIDEKLISHYLRGYFDGDGCFSYTKKTFDVSYISASKSFIYSITNIFDKLQLSYSVVEYISDNNIQMYRVYINPLKDKIKFLDYIYNNSHIYLERKFQKYKHIKKDYKT